MPEMTRRSLFAAIGAALAGAKAKVWPRPQLDINNLPSFIAKTIGRAKIGDTIMVRRPQRFRVTPNSEGAADVAEVFQEFLDRSFSLHTTEVPVTIQRPSELLAVEHGILTPDMEWRAERAAERIARESLRVLQESMDYDRVIQPTTSAEFVEPAGDIPMDSDEDEEEDWD